MSLTLILFVSSSISTSAAESSVIKVTEDLIIQMAERFAEAANPERNLNAANPIKIYSESGQRLERYVWYLI